MDILVHYYTSNNKIKSNKNFVNMICGTKVYILRSVTSEIKCHISDSKYPMTGVKQTVNRHVYVRLAQIDINQNIFAIWDGM